MFDGYLRLGGIELINAARTTAYVHNRLPSLPLVRRTDLYDTIRIALGDEPYRSPFLDKADWIETESFEHEVRLNPSHDFYGLYPLSIEGISDSTMEASVIEGILDGGTVNSERDATRSIRVRGLLLGMDELAVESGMTWLRNALRSNDCAMHGDGCGYQDLRYFLAKPDVCDPLWTSTYNAGDTVPFGPLSSETTPVEYFHGVEGQPHSYEWLLPVTDGVRIEWGARAFEGTQVLESYGPVWLRRTNFIVNPRFQNDVTTGWQISVDGVVEQGFGTPRYAELDQAAQMDYESNWLPDPSFENGDPTIYGWRSTTPGGVNRALDGTAPQGNYVAVVSADPNGVHMEATILGPDLGPNSTSTADFSLWVAQSTEDVTVEVFDSEGELSDSWVIPSGDLTSAWQRVDSYFAIAKNWVIRISKPTEELRVDGLSLGPSSSLPYFDGDTPDSGDNIYYFVGGSPANPSRWIDTLGNSFQTFSYTTNPTNAPSGSVVASFSLRAPFSDPTVTVELLAEDDSVLSSTSIVVPSGWTRYGLGTPYGRNVRLRFTSSTGPFELTYVMLEAAVSVNDYFDGSTPAPADYTVTWAAAPHASASRMTWTGSTLIERQDNWRPYLNLVEGSVQSAELEMKFGIDVEMQFQLRNFDRTYHEVYCTVGPQVIRRYELDSGAAWEVDFILTAANPHAYSTWSDLQNPNFDDPVLFTDRLTNYAPNPKSYTTTAGWTAAGTGVTGPTAVDSNDGIMATTLTGSQAAGTFGLTYTIAVGTGPNELPPNSYYSVGIDARMWTSVATYQSATLSVTGAGVENSQPPQTFSGNWGSGRRYIIFETASSGNVQINIRNNFTTIAGTNGISVRYLSIFFSTQELDWFDGDTASTSLYDFSWVGVPDASRSIRTLHVATQGPLVDPDLPPVPAPPAPPAIPDSALEDITDWVRYYVSIPAGDVAGWAYTIPTIDLSTGADEVRQVRVRFHPNPFEWPYASVDPLSYCGEFLLSYLPSNSTLTVTGVSESAWAVVSGGSPLPANQLLYGSDGGPMEWPELTCNIGYVMTVDIPPTSDIDNLDIRLSLTRRE